jgi:transposase
MSTRQRYVNTLRGILREFGFAIPLGVNIAKAQIGAALTDPDSEVPDALRATLAEILHEIRLLEEKILGIERQLNALTRADVRVQQLRQIPDPALSLRPSFRFLARSDSQRALQCRETPVGQNL